jgi:hypothetical protein
MIQNIPMNQELTLNPFFSPWGLRIDVKYKTPEPGRPPIFRYSYSVDNTKFQEWLKNNSFLCDSGPMMFSSRGIQVTIPAADEWSFTMFSIDNDNGKPIPLPLMESTTVFVIHRDLFSKKEWEIYIEVPDAVAQDRR